MQMILLMTSTGLVINKNYTEMHGQQNTKFGESVLKLEETFGKSDYAQL
jgi:hypothetical protein